METNPAECTSSRMVCTRTYVRVCARRVHCCQTSDALRPVRERVAGTRSTCAKARTRGGGVNSEWTTAQAAVSGVLSFSRGARGLWCWPLCSRLWTASGWAVGNSCVPQVRSLHTLWCGVMWCGAVWCGLVRCGVVWCGDAVLCCIVIMSGLILYCVVLLWYGVV